ncbi:MAG: hypothetical protein ABS54_12835 [Hyphomicrobium sp. SCN 65-11]|nr:MAG: hypothetical protein ABS54_12835 [Hyphomicrobium sp. SCN 65-11]
MMVAALPRRCVAGLIWAIALLPMTVWAKPAGLAFMQGVWSGPGLQLSLDTERMLANADPAKPFQWDALVIRNISDRMVTFWIGERRFIGLFDGDALSLSIEGSLETMRLERRSAHD